MLKEREKFDKDLTAYFSSQWGCKEQRIKLAEKTERREEIKITEKLISQSCEVHSHCRIW